MARVLRLDARTKLTTRPDFLKLEDTACPALSVSYQEVRPCLAQTVGGGLGQDGLKHHGNHVSVCLCGSGSSASAMECSLQLLWHVKAHLLRMRPELPVSYWHPAPTLSYKQHQNVTAGSVKSSLSPRSDRNPRVSPVTAARNAVLDGFKHVVPRPITNQQLKAPSDANLPHRCSRRTRLKVPSGAKSGPSESRRPGRRPRCVRAHACTQRGTAEPQQSYPVHGLLTFRQPQLTIRVPDHWQHVVTGVASPMQKDDLVTNNLQTSHGIPASSSSSELLELFRMLRNPGQAQWSRCESRHRPL